MVTYIWSCCAVAPTYSTAGSPGGVTCRGRWWRVDGVGGARTSVLHEPGVLCECSESRRCAKEMPSCVLRGSIYVGFGSDAGRWVYWQFFGQLVEMLKTAVSNFGADIAPRRPANRFLFWQISDWVKLEFMKCAVWIFRRDTSPIQIRQMDPDMHMGRVG